MSASRQSRDREDYQKLIVFFQGHNPFSTESKDLQNIVSGVVSHESVRPEIKISPTSSLTVSKEIFLSKYADISPAFKQADKFDKHNYRPVSLLPTLSKVFEIILFSQLEGYIDTYLSKHLYGFRKGHNTRNYLLVMMENMKLCIDNHGTAAALLTDLSKAFDCIKYILLTAKLNSYRLYYDSL